MKGEEFLNKFLAGQARKQKGAVEGDILLEWTHRVPARLRLLYVLGPVLLLLGYYAFKYFRGAEFSPIDVIVSFFLFVLGSRLAGSSRSYSITTVGAYELMGTNWRLLGKWVQFESCRREEDSVVLGKRKGFPKLVRLRCAEREKLLRLIALANEQISIHRWK